jgi:hypothetical protein
MNAGRGEDDTPPRPRLASGEYGPDLVRLMGDALESAWENFAYGAYDPALARLVMASAILDKVDAGVRAHDQLVTAAVSALTVAITLSKGGFEA